MADIQKWDTQHFDWLGEWEKTGFHTNLASWEGLETAVTLLPGEVGVFAGGMDTDLGYTKVNVMEYIIITTLGNAKDFGNLTLSKYLSAGASNGVYNRGLFLSGDTGTPGGPVRTAVIDYINIVSKSNASNFGNMLQSRNEFGSTDNGTNGRAISAGNGVSTNVIEYVTISTGGNGTDFGDLIEEWIQNDMLSNGTNERGIIIGGKWKGGYSTDVIQYVTISTLGNAVEFGHLLYVGGVTNNAATSNGTNNRGVTAGSASGNGTTNQIQYITISSLGDSIDFGDLTVSTGCFEGLSNGTSQRGIFGGGINSGTTSFDVIQYITINSVGNATDFGDLSSHRWGVAATSNA